MTVFLLWHSRDGSFDTEDSKLIGVYATEADADAARLRVVSQPGFRDFPDGFVADEYEVGKDHWEEGFITVADALERLREQDELDRDDLPPPC